MRRKFVTLHLDKKLLTTETIGTLHAVIDAAACHCDPQFVVNADKTVTIKVGDWREFGR